MSKKDIFYDGIQFVLTILLDAETFPKNINHYVNKLFNLYMIDNLLSIFYLLYLIYVYHL